MAPGSQCLQLAVDSDDNTDDHQARGTAAPVAEHVHQCWAQHQSLNPTCTLGFRRPSTSDARPSGNFLKAAWMSASFSPGAGQALQRQIGIAAGRAWLARGGQLLQGCW